MRDGESRAAMKDVACADAAVSGRSRRAEPERQRTRV
jgi:hypothetical protein